MEPASKASVLPDYVSLPDEALLRECDVNVHRTGGPGGQHRNKVSSAVRLVHRPTGVAAHGQESRSQHENRREALKRLRMNIACQVRRPVDLQALHVPEVVAGCLFVPKKAKPGAEAPRRLEVGRRDERFWAVGQFLLDLLDACGGRLAEAAGLLGITSSNLVGVLKDDRHLLAAGQEIRKRHGQGALK